MTYLLGIDVGTSSAKAVLMNATGEVIATAAPEYPFVTPKPLWAESNPADWWTGTVDAIAEVCAKAGIESTAIEAVGLTGQMHGLVLLDATGKVLRPCIMWNDQRTAKQCANLTAKVGADEVLRITGNPILTGFTAPKVAWVREHEPEVFAQAAKILLPKDYVRYRLSGTFATDVSDASGMSLLDVGKRTWSDTMVDSLGIPRGWLADVSESAEATATISSEAATATGLRAGVPIAAGAGDQAAQAVGCGIVREGIMSATFGTSGVVFAHSRECRVEHKGKLHAFCAAVPGEWHLMGVMLSAAGSLQYFRDTFCAGEMAQAQREQRDVYDILSANAATTEPGAEGLLFLPYLTGERTPHPDPLARGVLFGLTRRHTKAHITRSVFEGITYGMRDSLELMRALGIKSETVVASGGGAKSPFWRQLMADVFESRISLVNATEGAAYGAAILGGVAGGVFPDVPTAAATCITETASVEPDSNATAKYSKAHRRYQALYPALKEAFAAAGE